MPNQEISILNKIIVTLIFCICFLEASSQEYKENADSLKLSEQRYWQLLLHATNNVSEIDDSTFFLATDGKTNPKMNSTQHSMHSLMKRGWMTTPQHVDFLLEKLGSKSSLVLMILSRYIATNMTQHSKD